jgi:hypothetical protein
MVARIDSRTKEGYARRPDCLTSRDIICSDTSPGGSCNTYWYLLGAPHRTPLALCVLSDCQRRRIKVKGRCFSLEGSGSFLSGNHPVRGIEASHVVVIVRSLCLGPLAVAHCRKEKMLESPKFEMKGLKPSVNESNPLYVDENPLYSQIYLAHITEHQRHPFYSASHIF